jgi:pyruvate formate lyase activating enzyme
MRIGGLRKFSLIDYPGRISAVVFAQGCNFRCPYCHNRGLLEEGPSAVTEAETIAFLDSRRGLLDGVVVTGGEPLLQESAAGFIREVKAMGYPVKLDTNGSNPAALEAGLRQGMVDYVAMDYKAPLGKYGTAAGCRVDTDAIRRSVGMIVGSGVAYEMRTTLFSGLTAGDIIEAMDELRDMGVQSCYLQMFVYAQGCSRDLSVSGLDTAYLSAELAARFPRCGIRNTERA